MFFIQQANDHDCGFTAVKILLANIHHDSNYLFLKSPFTDNVSFLDLIKEAKKYNVELEGLKSNDKEGLEKCDRLPFIARVTFDNASHALYVYRITKKYVYYYDPARGEKRLSIDEFKFIWSGEMLAIKTFTKTKCEFKRPKLMKNSEAIISLCISLMSAITSLLAVYFVSKDSYIYLPVIFFALMIISELVLKKYSLSIMKHIDKRVDELIKDVKKKDYYEFYINYEGYKKYLIINNLTMFSNCYIFIIISFIFILNDKYNGLFVVLNVLLAMLYISFIKPKLNEEEKRIIEEESKIKTKNNKLEAFNLMNNARSLSYKYVSIESAYKYVVIGIEVISTFIMMMYKEIVNVTYIICYSGLQMYLYNNVVSLLSRGEDYQKQYNLLNKIINMSENK